MSGKDDQVYFDKIDNISGLKDSHLIPTRQITATLLAAFRSRQEAEGFLVSGRRIEMEARGRGIFTSELFAEAKDAFSKSLHGVERIVGVLNYNSEVLVVLLTIIFKYFGILFWPSWSL